MQKIGLGGGCHWCTEGVFLSLSGVKRVQQGWISSFGEHDLFSEGIIVYYDERKIKLYDLIEIHLLTHSATNMHKRRDKYRSAVYFFEEKQSKECNRVIAKLQVDFEEKIITKVLEYKDFKENVEEQLNYFYKDANKPFCRAYIHPKIEKLLKTHRNLISEERLNELN